MSPARFRPGRRSPLSGIGNLADTVRDRGIEIEMKRKLRSEKVRRLRNRDGGELADPRRMAVRWAADNIEKLRFSDPKIPDGLNDRASDTWEPLLAIGELAGGGWPKQAGEAARLLSGDGAVEDENHDAMLFADIQRAFDEKGTDRLSSTELTTFLLTLDDRPWPEWQNGRPLSKSQLSRTLKRYGIVSGTIRLEGATTLKGYYLSAFADAFQHYTVQNNAAESVTTSHAQRNEGVRRILGRHAKRRVTARKSLQSQENQAM